MIAHGATVPAFSHETTTGDGSLPVTCRFDFDTDGDIETLQVLHGGVDIFKGLSLEQIEALETECYASAEKDFEDSKIDAVIDNFIESKS